MTFSNLQVLWKLNTLITHQPLSFAKAKQSFSKHLLKRFQKINCFSHILRIDKLQFYTEVHRTKNTYYIGLKT